MGITGVTMYKLICIQCSKEFTVKERRHFDGKRKRKFCSQLCSGKYIFESRKENVLETCFKKGHKYFPKKIKLPPKPPKLLFGKDNPAYKHGKNCGRRHKLYTSLAIENFSKECLICKTNKMLHVHHIDGIKTNHSIDNLCILCNSCHQRFHRCKIKLVNPYMISIYIENQVSKLNLRNEFLRIKRRRVFLKKVLANQDHNFQPIC